MSARKKPTFEEAVARIEEIVNKLENEQVSLEESIKLYTEGMELSVICRQKLTEAEGKVTMLQKNFRVNISKCHLMRGAGKNELERRTAG